MTNSTIIKASNQALLHYSVSSNIQSFTNSEPSHKKMSSEVLFLDLPITYSKHKLGFIPPTNLNLLQAMIIAYSGYILQNLFRTAQNYLFFSSKEMAKLLFWAYTKNHLSVPKYSQYFGHKK